VRLETSVAQQADRIVATCRDEVAELLRMGVRRRPVDIVPCGVDLGLFTPDGPALPRTGRPRLVVVGRLVERKGVQTVIEALRRLPDAELLVAGGPDVRQLDADPDVRRLREVAEAAGVADRVLLLGRVLRADMPALLRSADVVVTVPWYEPFGIVPLEAMACGRPVVAAAVGGLLDTVAAGVTGVLVPPRQPDRLAAAVAPLLADRSLLDRMGRAAVERAHRRYGWPGVARRTAQAYADAVRLRRGSALPLVAVP
jgi:glycosyltransferase involved in cell wall biosynthesis